MSSKQINNKNNKANSSYSNERKNIEELITKMEILTNTFIILGLVIDYSYYDFHTMKKGIDETKLCDDMFIVKATSITYTVAIYDLLSYLNAEMMFLKFNKGSIYTLRQDSKFSSYPLYSRLPNKPYCDLYYSHKFPKKLDQDSNVDQEFTLKERFHNVYDRLENTYGEIRLNFETFITEQEYQGNMFKFDTNELGNYQLLVDGTVITSTLVNSFNVKFIPVLKFIDDFKIALKNEKKVLVINNNNLLLNNHESNLTKYRNKYKSNVKYGDLNINYYLYVKYQDSNFIKSLSEQSEFLLMKLNYKFFYETNEHLFVS
jgi:hypothetical protein